MDNNSVKKNLKNSRKEKRITQKEMAEKMGISRTAYRNLEEGDTKLLSDHIGQFARILGKSEEELVLGYHPAVTGKALRDSDADGKAIAILKKDLETKTALIRALQDTISSQLDLISTLSEKIV